MNWLTLKARRIQTKEWQVGHDTVRGAKAFAVACGVPHRETVATNHPAGPDGPLSMQVPRQLDRHILALQPLDNSNASKHISEAAM